VAPFRPGLIWQSALGFGKSRPHLDDSRARVLNARQQVATADRDVSDESEKSELTARLISCASSRPQLARPTWQAVATRLLSVSADTRMRSPEQRARKGAPRTVLAGWEGGMPQPAADATTSVLLQTR
jgi:hypothetical protein